MREKLEYYILKIFIWFLGLLPNKTIYKITHFFAILFFKYEKRRSGLTVKNLRLAFPTKSEKEIYKLAKKSYESLSITLAEVIMLFNDKINIENKIINKETTLKKLKELSRKNSNGIIFVTAHFSNWELLAQFLPKNGYPMIAIGRKGNNQLIEHYFTTPFREKYGNTNVYKNNAILKLVKTLKSGGYTGLLIDQKASGPTSIKVNFFGEPADTTTSVATLKLKFNPIVIPMFIARESSGNYSIIIKDTEEGKNNTIESLTQEYNNILEEVIKAYPEQWFWMHNRWRLP